MPATLQRIPAVKGVTTWDSTNLIDQLLTEQKQLQTPVARFSDRHDKGSDLADHFRQFIPLSKPEAGEQFAFEVSLDRCTGCKACVSACHSLNGLDEGESWRDTGVLLGGSATPGWQQTITTACHHCEDPGCLSGCPVGAYEKDPVTGIVRHLDDQCIGCSYCILMCPYDVPKYSNKLGIVRKCDMCHQRLSEGEAPACVQACPTEAIRIVKVTCQRAGGGNQEINLFPSSIRNPQSAIPDSSITLPTTRYVGRAVPESAHAADRAALLPQHAHWPLVFMLALTQAGIGLLCGGGLHPPSQASPFTQAPYQLALLGTLIFNLGMIAATLHLGQPLKAWRFFIGLKTSWLSREILAFSLFAPIPLLLVALPYTPDFPFKQHFSILTSHSTLPLGLLAVFTSVMIYHDTRRALWHFPRTAIRFFGTVASFSSLGFLIAQPEESIAKAVFATAVILKLLPEILFLRRSLDAEWSPDQHSARLQIGPLRAILVSRVAFALVAILAAMIQPWAALPLLLVTEILERQLFFQSVHAPKMPGHFGPASH